MTEDVILPILINIQDRLTGIENTLNAMRAEIDGGFHRMAGTDGRVEGLRMIVDAQGRRITALERKP
jgi:archaellum component FlaC